LLPLLKGELVRFRYLTASRQDKGVIIQYLIKVRANLVSSLLA
jgi:hypothetical protein